MSKTIEKQDTKKCIITAAQKLFANKGYEGTSIRDIASSAGANIAAVNYHFKNKQNLYWEVFLGSRIWLESHVEKISKSTNSVEELTWELFSFLHENSNFLRNVFMMMLSDSFPQIDENVKSTLAKKDEVGPPGAKYILAAITSEVGSDVSIEKKNWAVEVLFSHVVHWALLLSGSNCQEVYKNHPMFRLDERKKSFRFHVESTLSFIQNTK